MKTRIAVAATAALLAAFVHPARAQGFVGDVNADGFVGALDLDIVLLDWANAPPNDPRADPSGDGAVGQDDLDILEADWGQGVTVALAPISGIVLHIGQIDNIDWLPAYVTQDLRIETNTDWLGAQLVVALDEPGKIYQHPLSDTNPVSPVVTWPYPPELEFDTWVTNRYPGDPVSLNLAGAVDLGGESMWTFDRDAISIAWYGTGTNDTGKFPLARVTLADDATGTWSFLATAAPAEGPLLLASGPVVDGHMVPEPATLVLVGCGAACLAGRTSKQEAATT